MDLADRPRWVVEEQGQRPVADNAAKTLSSAPLSQTRAGPSWEQASARRPSRYRAVVVHESKGFLRDAARLHASRPPPVFDGAGHRCRRPGGSASAARLRRPSKRAGGPRAERNSPRPSHFRPASSAKLRPASAAFPLSVGHLRVRLKRPPKSAVAAYSNANRTVPYFRSVTDAPMLSWSLCKDLGASSREETGK